MKRAKVNEIIVRKAADHIITYTDKAGKERKKAEKRFTITTTEDGKVREGFTSISDAAEWVGTMKAHGLFKGVVAWYESPEGRQLIEPSYENPCECPVIAKFV